MAQTIFGKIKTASIRFEVEGRSDDWKERDRLSFRLHLSAPFKDHEQALVGYRVIRIPEGTAPAELSGYKVSIDIDDEPEFGRVYAQELHLGLLPGDKMGYVLRAGRRWMVVESVNQLMEDLPRFLATAN